RKNTSPTSSSITWPRPRAGLSEATSPCRKTCFSAIAVQRPLLPMKRRSPPSAEPAGRWSSPVQKLLPIHDPPVEICDEAHGAVVRDDNGESLRAGGHESIRGAVARPDGGRRLRARALRFEIQRLMDRLGIRQFAGNLGAESEHLEALV